MGSRGGETEYLELLKGDLPSNTNLFEGIDTSWNRVQGGEAIGKILYEIEKKLQFWKSVGAHSQFDQSV